MLACFAGVVSVLNGLIVAGFNAELFQYSCVPRIYLLLTEPRILCGNLLLELRPICPVLPLKLCVICSICPATGHIEPHLRCINSYIPKVLLSFESFVEGGDVLTGVGIGDTRGCALLPYPSHGGESRLQDVAKGGYLRHLRCVSPALLRCLILGLEHVVYALVESLVCGIYVIRERPED